MMRQYALAANSIEELKDQIGTYEKKIQSLEMTNNVFKGQIPQQVSVISPMASQTKFGLSTLAQLNSLKLQLGVGPMPMAMPSLHMNMLALEEVKKHTN